MAEGRKFLQQQIDEGTKEIARLKDANELLGRERNAFKEEVLLLLQGKPYYSFKRLLRIRKDYKKIKK